MVAKLGSGSRKRAKKHKMARHTSYFHDYIYNKAEIRFVRGRLRFTNDDGQSLTNAPFPSMIVVYN